MSSVSMNSVMAMRNAIIQKNAALRDASSVGGIGQGSPLGGSGAVGGTQQPDFTAALKSALSSVNDLQGKAGDAMSAYEKGDTTDIAAVMLAKQQASVGFEATLQVRNKLLSAYKDIMSMPV